MNDTSTLSDRLGFLRSIGFDIGERAKKDLDGFGPIYLKNETLHAYERGWQDACEYQFRLLIPYLPETMTGLRPDGHPAQLAFDELPTPSASSYINMWRFLDAHPAQACADRFNATTFTPDHTRDAFLRAWKRGAQAMLLALHPYIPQTPKNQS